MNWQDRLTAAEGYIELLMFLEANDELERMSAEDRSRPEVYNLRYRIYLGLGRYEAAR